MVKPKVVISRCLGFQPCRYNGQMYDEDFIRKMREHIDFITICPEMDLGMEVPRESVRIVIQNGKTMLLQQNTGKDFYDEMQKFIYRRLSDFKDVDGFILKSKSPSCGIKDTKIYQGTKKSSSSIKGGGIFGSEVLKCYGNLPVEDEGRLKNYRIREYFLTRLYALKHFKQVKNSKSFEELMDFHNKNTFLFMSFNQREFASLNKLLTEYKSQEISIVFNAYEKHLAALLSRTQRLTSNVKVLSYITDVLSPWISLKEKTFILKTIGSYEKKELPLVVPRSLIQLSLVRFDKNDILNQTYFCPYPTELMELGDSGKGRDF